MAKISKINDKDNVAVCLEPVKRGDIINSIINEKVIELQILKGHKIATESIRKGGYVIKYGEVIGIAVEDIPLKALMYTFMT